MDRHGLPVLARGDNVDSQTITPVGNCWIICRSKSHAGRIYYFNTLTGEAVWNLSNVEIEKAKKRTSSILENQPETVLESCPEPKEPPTDNNNCRHKKFNCQASKVYNKQILNNKYSKPQYAPVINSQCITCSPAKINRVGVTMPTATSLNSNVWAIPHSHQIVIAPASQLVNTNQTTLLNTNNNEIQQVSVQNTSVPLSRRFNCIEEPTFYNRSHQGSHEFSPRYNYNNCMQRKNSSSFYNNYQGPSTSNDLRQRLNERRNFQWNKSYDYQGKGGHHKFQNEYVQNSDQKIQIIKPTAEELFPIEADERWLKEHAFVEGTQLKLNVEPLKNIVMPDVDLLCWYIVADSDVLLHHCNLINIIVNSDVHHCQLMIPEETMAELHSISRSDDAQLMSRAHRVLRLLSQQFTSGHAVIGKESSSNCVDIVDFTVKLAEQHRNVVLVCQSIRRENVCKENTLPIFTIQEIKEILINAPKKPVLHQPNPQTPPEESLIKITIPNEPIQKQSIDRSLRFCTSNETICDLDVNTEIPTGETINNISNNFEKVTHEMGVQTEYNPVIEKPTSNKVLHLENYIDHSLNSKLDTPNNNISNINNTIDNDKSLYDIPKKREIRLKRNITQQPANVNNNIEKKQFKWRRRKENLSNKNIDSEQAEVDVTDSSKEKHDQHNFTEQSVTDQNLSQDSYCDEPTQLKDSNDCNLSDTTSTLSFNNRGFNESRVTVDETSTSGVISNTGSNVDSESVNSSKQNINYVNEEQGLSKCVMFEVESAVMEEQLQTRSDEWLYGFIQIMEEVLTQILHLESSQSYDHILPPPWTLHEATECIKRMFNGDCDVKDASSKLTNILYNISDARGVINQRLKPVEFMEMYSYGVYLVDSLQAILSDCDDLQTAADSLAKLLADIQNLNNNSNNNDSLENIDDPSAIDTLSSRANSIQEGSTCSITPRTDQGDDNLSKNKSGQENRKIYDLRSNKNETNVEETGVKFIRNMDIESTFFSFLNLKRNENAAISYPMPKRLENNLESNPNPNDAVENKESKNTEPKIIRHFSKFLEFEERLKNKAREALDMDHLDYNEDDQEEDFDCYEGEYNSEAVCYPNENTENEDMYEMNSGDDSQAKKDADINGNHLFKCIVGKIMKEVQEAFTEVSSFCKEVCDELNIPKSLSPVRKLQIKERADKAKTHLDHLYKSLNSVLYREDAGRENDIKTIMNKAGVFFDCDMVAEYRKNVAKTLEQADVLLESVSIVMEAVK